MGGLMASAAGALSNWAAASGSELPGVEGVSVDRSGVSSMAEWQISQAEQAAEWWACESQTGFSPSQGACRACRSW